MSWWGKLIGGAFGFMLGGPLGALLGAALGHNFDKGVAGPSGFEGTTRERVQTAFFTASFSVMGHISKADGRVSEDEIALAKQVMQQMELNSVQRKAAISLFNSGKQAGFPLDDVLLQLKKELGFRPNLKRMFFEIQIMLAYADGVMDRQEERLLRHCCQVLDFPVWEFERLKEMIKAERHHRQTARASRGMSLKDAYSILNVSNSTADAEVKKAYRRLISQHHPDKLASKGLPEEMMKVAAQRTHEIKQAYEAIKKERGF